MTCFTSLRLCCLIERSLLGKVLFVLLFTLSPGTVFAGDQLYTCGMHPQIIKHEPGDCPICGMKLTPLRANGTASDNAVMIDAATVQRMNLKTALVTTGPLQRHLHTAGSVVLNEESLRDVTLRYEAWVEKVFANSTWKSLAAGDPLVEVYSPDLYNAELNFVVAKKTEGEAGGPLTHAARTRLQLLSLPEAEIVALGSTLEVPRTRVLTAEAAGLVLEKMVVPGQMMKPGERFFRLGDLHTVWILAQIYESDLAFVKEGQAATVRLSYGAATEYVGKIDKLLPLVDEQSRTVTARIVLENPGLVLRPGMFVEVALESRLADSVVLVPEAAVLRSGEMNTVFIAGPAGSFEPREVHLGLRSEDGYYEVLSGLTAGERIVTSGQFMLDSESQLREAIGKMIKGESASVHATPAAPAPEVQDFHKSGAVPVLYTCPMEEHSDVVSEKPGPCPKCHMTLVPTSTVDHGKDAEAVWLKAHATSSK